MLELLNLGNGGLNVARLRARNHEALVGGPCIRRVYTHVLCCSTDACRRVRHTRSRLPADEHTCRHVHMYVCRGTCGPVLLDVVALAGCRHTRSTLIAAAEGPRGVVRGRDAVPQIVHSAVKLATGKDTLGPSRRRGDGHRTPAALLVCAAGASPFLICLNSAGARHYPSEL